MNSATVCLHVTMAALSPHWWLCCFNTYQVPPVDVAICTLLTQHCLGIFVAKVIYGGADWSGEMFVVHTFNLIVQMWHSWKFWISGEDPENKIWLTQGLLKCGKEWYNFVSCLELHVYWLSKPDWCKLKRFEFEIRWFSQKHQLDNGVAEKLDLYSWQFSGSWKFVYKNELIKSCFEMVCCLYVGRNYVHNHSRCIDCS